ncbi:SIMPL domain-containing protein [Streptomyces spiroverticillatus]|uniref:SIMPL domain-containing protein n=1 Tax=Streptomyces finlayi TaxID=67296 RepID=A0A918WYV0_9ACTN|nr:SIMPL domain-containing protein [Streptomyces finlayi]GHA15125.1 SIMPL domain-containing protein [Streptomyces spiroverticillatus]GHC96869.1 SIMPL domain-containing protein [Streptomyces finlayi]
MPLLPPAPRLIPSRVLVATALAGGLLVAGAVPASALASAPATAGVSHPAPATVTVTGSGEATATPDTAFVAMGVEATALTTKEALAAQSTAAQALLAAVRAQGVADRDVRTENLSLNPVYQYDNGNQRLTGYQAGQGFSVRVRDLSRTGAVIQAAMDAAGNAGRVSGVTFDVADPAPLRAAARRAAHLDAREKAAQHARLSGRSLGRLVSLTESDPGRPRPVEVPAGALADAPPSVPVAPGQVKDEVVVTAVYELD